MTYELRKPTNVEPNKVYPTLFVLHGMGSNEQNMLPLVDELKDQFYIFSIRGPLVQPPGFAYFTIQGFGKPHRTVFDLAIEQLSCFIDDAVDHYPLDQNHLYLLGFSQGAIASMTIGLTRGNRIKGIIALSGYIPEFVKEEYAFQPVDQLSLFISHGESDHVLPYEWGVESHDFFKKLGAHVTFEAYPEGHTVSMKNKQDFTKWILTDLNQ